MEEKIKKSIELLKDETAIYDANYCLATSQALKNVLSELERLQKENEELLKNSIPKEEIEGKLEKLANLEHERWAKWQKYVHDICIKNEDGSLTIPKDRVEHWNYEIETKYKDLPEHLKEYDRQEIRIFLKELLEEEK